MSYTGYGMAPVFATYAPQYGFGQAAPAGDAGALVADAFKSVVDSAVPLSPPSQVFTTIAKVNIESLIGVPISQIEQAAIQQIPAAITNIVASAIGDAAQAIPIINTIIGWVTGVFSILESQKQADQAKLAQDCQSYLQKMAVQNSGSLLAGCLQCPADIFGEYISISHGLKARPMLGSMLISMTEGREDAPMGFSIEQFCSNHSASACKYEKKLQSNRYKRITHHDRAEFNAPNLGVPLERRRLFKKIREALTAVRSVPGNDGGVSLWTIYMDMLLQEFDEGHLTWKYAADLIGDAVYITDNAWHVERNTTTRSCLVKAALPALKTMLDNWRNTVRPTTHDGIQKLAEIQSSLPKIAALVNQKPIPASVLQHFAASMQAFRKPAPKLTLAPAAIKAIMAMAKPKPKPAPVVRPAPAKKLHPAVAVGIGAGAAGLALLLLA